jgi:hypothetical protein
VRSILKLDLETALLDAARNWRRLNRKKDFILQRRRSMQQSNEMNIYFKNVLHDYFSLFPPDRA